MKQIIFSIILVFTVTLSFSQVKISEMPTATDPSGGWIPIIQNGVNKKIATDNLLQKGDSIVSFNLNENADSSILLLRDGRRFAIPRDLNRPEPDSITVYANQVCLWYYGNSYCAYIPRDTTHVDWTLQVDSAAGKAILGIKRSVRDSMLNQLDSLRITGTTVSGKKNGVWMDQFVVPGDGGGGGDTSKWTVDGSSIYPKGSRNLLIGTTVDDGHPLRVDGPPRFDLGGDLEGDIPYRDDLGGLKAVHPPVGLTKPVLGHNGTTPVWEEDTGGGGGVTATQVHTTGATVTVADTTTWLIINPATLLAAVTATLPATPTDGQVVDISFGGTITASGATVVTSFTVVANTGQGLIGTGTYGLVETDDHLSYKYRLSTLKWYRN